MKDIILNSWFRKITYICGFIGIILAPIISWIILLGLTTYGKDTADNVEKKKGILNKTWQKFVYCFGFYFYILLTLTLILIIIDSF